MHYVFDPPPQPSIPVAGSSRHFPVHRIYCVGRNYAAHVREMGGNPDRELPFFFLKPASALVAPGCAAAYPPGTTNLHHEVELVVAIGRPAAAISTAQALEVVWGYAVGNDLTRRDLQLAARDKGRPMGFWQILRRIGANLRAASEQLDRASLERRDLAQGQRQRAPTFRSRADDLDGA
jgi:fumarylpyruvate hydrolase